MRALQHQAWHGSDVAVTWQEEGGDEENGEETSTQRSRRKKRELAAFESRGAKLKAVPDEPPPEDEEGEEMTALMMAAANGFEACVRELLYAGASRHGLALSGPAFAVSLLPRPALAALTRRDAQAPSPRWCARRV